jgi:hypothetical protein
MTATVLPGHTALMGLPLLYAPLQHKEYSLILLDAQRDDSKQVG